MKKNLFLVVALAAVLVVAFATTAFAAGHSVYKGYSTTDSYLSWDGANYLNLLIKGADDTQTASPHGGYTQTSVKCNVCHSIHRAKSSLDSSSGALAAGGGVGADWNLLGAAGGCVSCHATWGSTPSDALVEVGQTNSGPHIGAGGATCSQRGCHGSVHGMGAQSEYAIVRQYNLGNPAYNDDSADGLSGYDVDTRGATTLDAEMDEAITLGNYNGGGVPTLTADARNKTGDSMKAFVTGYVCNDCHGLSSFSVAKSGFASVVATDANSWSTSLTLKTGHPSAADQFYGHAPVCEKCHDLVGVATGSTAWPHANRGIDVYKGRLEYSIATAGGYNEQDLVGSDVAPADGIVDSIPTSNSDATRYGLWMTGSSYDATENITPLVYGGTFNGSTTTTTTGGFSIRDASCLKCHDTDPANPYALP